MPAPVISASSSILGFRRREPFAFQPGAANSPASWAATSLPPGVTINTTTGLISGQVETAGVYVFTVSATNADGTGSREFVLGIAPEIYVASPTGANSDYIPIHIRLPSGSVTIPGLTAAADTATSTATSPTPAPDREPAPLITLTEGDTRMLAIQFLGPDNAVVDPDPATLRIAIKILEPEPAAIEASAFAKTGSGSTALYLLPLQISSPALAGYLSDAEADTQTTVLARAEIEWTRQITHLGNPLTLRASTQQFPIRIARDLADN